jgi:hypothetical protein
LVTQEKLTRALVAGGDTSSHAARQLGLSALTLATPIAPGSPLCRGHAPGGALDGLEIALKGGQVGGATYFRQVLDGRHEPGAAVKLGGFCGFDRKSRKTENIDASKAYLTTGTVQCVTTVTLGAPANN